MRFKVSRRQPTDFRQLSVYLSGPGKEADQSKAFDETALYLSGEAEGHTTDRVLWMETRNLQTEDPRAAAAIMAATTRDKPNRCKKPVYHFILSFDPEDDKAGKINPEMMKEIADKALTRLELQEHQSMIYAHQDKDHPHIHFLVNRIHPVTGKAWNRHNEGRRLLEFCGDMAREYGLNIPRDKDRKREKEQELSKESIGLKPLVPEAQRDRAQMTSADLERVAEKLERGDPLTEILGRAKKDKSRNPYPMAKVDVEAHRGRMKEAFKSALSWDDIARIADREGLQLMRKGQGLVLSNGTTAMKLSDMGRDCSMGKLQHRFGQQFDDWRRERAVNIMVASDHDPRAQAGEKVAAVTRADRADLAVRDMTFVVEEVHRSELRMGRHANDAEKAKRLFARVSDVETDRKASLSEAVALTWRNPSEALRLWDKLEDALGVDGAKQMVVAEPDVLGALRGTEVKGRKSMDRKTAQEAFLAVTTRRLHWQEARDRLGRIRNEIDTHHRQLNKARRDHKRLLKDLGMNAGLVRAMRDRIARRAEALDRLTPRMIREAGLSNRRREELHRAYKEHEQRKRQKQKRRERERDIGLKL